MAAPDAAGSGPRARPARVTPGRAEGLNPGGHRVPPSSSSHTHRFELPAPGRRGLSCRQLLRERAGEKEASSREEGARGQEGSPPAPGDPPALPGPPSRPGEAAGSQDRGPLARSSWGRSRPWWKRGAAGDPPPQRPSWSPRGVAGESAPGKSPGGPPPGIPHRGGGTKANRCPAAAGAGRAGRAATAAPAAPRPGNPAGSSGRPRVTRGKSPQPRAGGGRPREGSGRHRAAPEEPRGDGTPAYSGHPRPGETRRRHRERPWRASSPQARSPGSRRRVRGPAGPPLARDPGTGTPGSAGPGPAAAAAAALPPPVPRRRRPLAAAGGGDAVGRSTAEGHRWEWDRQGILRWEGELRDLKKICSCQGATASWEAGQASADPLETRDTVHGA